MLVNNKKAINRQTKTEGYLKFRQVNIVRCKLTSSSIKQLQLLHLWTSKT